MTTPLISYHNDPALKSAFLVEIGKHEAADALQQGSYGQMNGSFHGCAIGCSVYSLNVLQGKTPQEAALGVGEHDRLPKDLGWPLWLAYAEDNIFERLPIELAKTWPRRLAEAMPVGASEKDLDLVLAKILHWTLMHERFGNYILDSLVIQE